MDVVKDIPLEDSIALVLFFVAWIGYAFFSESPGHLKNSLFGCTSDYRRRWIQQMALRHDRAMDVNIVRGLMQTNSFIASTTIFIIGGLLASLSARAESVNTFLRHIPFAADNTALLLEVKIFVVTMVFFYSFFKHIWALRQLNYTAILVGSFPPPSDELSPNDEESRILIERLTSLSVMSGKHFNRGMRAYYFGIAAMSWIIHPYVFMGLTLWMVYALYRREFLPKKLQRFALS